MGADMQVNMHEAKSQLSKLGQLAWEGEEVIIARAGKPFLKLVPYREEQERRPLGIWKGKIQMAPDFDETSLEIFEAFEGKWSNDSF